MGKGTCTCNDAPEPRGGMPARAGARAGHSCVEGGKAQNERVQLVNPVVALARPTPAEPKLPDPLVFLPPT